MYMVDYTTLWFSVLSAETGNTKRKEHGNIHIFTKENKCPMQSMLFI